METLFTIYIFVYACNKVLAVYQAGLRKCLCNGWFMLELTITVTGIVVIVLEFVEARQIFIALLLALVVLNSFRVFRVNRHFVTLVETFRAADRSLLHWCFVVLVLLIAYASYANAVLGFNPKLEGYRNLGESMATLVTFSVGLFMSDEYPGLTQYTAFVFTVFFMTLLYTMCFVTILLEAFTYTRMLVGAKYSKNSALLVGLKYSKNSA
nr:hypothetical protein BaRGS_006236 [Batillaria attramentaria]